jgi:hypothetical protein
MPKNNLSREKILKSTKKFELEIMEGLPDSIILENLKNAEIRSNYFSSARSVDVSENVLTKLLMSRNPEIVCKTLAVFNVKQKYIKQFIGHENASVREAAYMTAQKMQDYKWTKKEIRNGLSDTSKIKNIVLATDSELLKDVLTPESIKEMYKDKSLCEGILSLSSVSLGDTLVNDVLSSRDEAYANSDDVDVMNGAEWQQAILIANQSQSINRMQFDELLMHPSKRIKLMTWMWRDEFSPTEDQWIDFIENTPEASVMDVLDSRSPSEITDGMAVAMASKSPNLVHHALENHNFHPSLVLIEKVVMVSQTFGKNIVAKLEKALNEKALRPLKQTRLRR